MDTWAPAGRYSTYATCPLPTMADKLLFILTYLKQNPIQELQGQLFGMSHSNANKWIDLLHPVLNQALADQEPLPARTADDLAAMLTMSPTEASAPSSLFFMMDLTAPPASARPRGPARILQRQEEMSHAQKPPRDQGDLSRVFLEPHL